MKILLFGEYSNVHWTLAEALRRNEINVTVASDGDGWKNYRRDINIDYISIFGFLRFFLSIFFDKRFRGNDIVQLINYRFLFKNRLAILNVVVFKFLKRYNKKVVLAAFGDDYYYFRASISGQLKYDITKSLDLQNSKDILNIHLSKIAKYTNRYIAKHVDGIVSCMYDYYFPYSIDFSKKLVNIPLPVDLSQITINENKINGKLSVFFGIQKARFRWKGGDIIMKAFDIVQKKHEGSILFHTVENLPYEEYQNIYGNSNLFFDQIYSYGQGMNGLLALAKGKILFGGGDFESYELVSEYELHPIISITNDIDDIVLKIEYFINNPSEVSRFSELSKKYIKKHHDSDLIAKKYIHLYKDIIRNRINNSIS